MSNSVLNYRYLFDRVKVLKDNEIYRINDVIKLSVLNSVSNHKICCEILNNSKYTDTILYTYLSRCKNTDLKDKIQLLKTVIDENTKNKNYVYYNENYLVVHIRSGDAFKNFGLGCNKIFNNLLSQINTYCQNYKTIKNIIIVTALHYGHTNYPGLYAVGNSYPTKYAYKKSNHVDNIIHLEKFISKINLPVSIVSSSEIDNDLVILSTCKFLITSKGGFSNLISKLNKINN